MQGTLAKIIGRMERILTAFTAVVMGILSIVVCWQVFARYVLQKSPYWVEEFSVTAMMWIGLLGAAASVWTGDHMRLEFVTKRLPRKFGLALEILIDAAIGYFAWFLLRQGTVLTQATWDSMMSTIPLPLGFTYLVIPIAAVFMILFALFRIMNKIYEVRKTPEEKGGPADAR